MSAAASASAAEAAMSRTTARSVGAAQAHVESRRMLEGRAVRERREERIAGDLAEPARYLGGNVGISRDRQVRSVLLYCADREHCDSPTQRAQRSSIDL